MGIISGAMAGAGEAGVAAGLQAQRQFGEQDLVKMRADADQELAKTRALLDRETHATNVETDIAAIPKKGEAETKVAVKREEALRPGAVATRKEFAAVDTQAAVDTFTKLDPLKRKSELEAAVEKVKEFAKPEMLAASRSVALAQLPPQYTLVPNADGTMTKFDVHGGKQSGLLEGPDGKPLQVRDPSQIQAASSVINMANTNLRIAQAEHKTIMANVSSTDEERAGANAAWKAAQEEANRITMPAYAVLYSGARAEGKPGDKAPAAPAIKDRFKETPGTQRAATGAEPPGSQIVQPTSPGQALRTSLVNTYVPDVLRAPNEAIRRGLIGKQLPPETEAPTP